MLATPCAPGVLPEEPLSNKPVSCSVCPNGMVPLLTKRVNTPMEPAEITIQAMTAATTFSAVLPPRFFFGVGGVKAAGGTEW